MFWLEFLNPERDVCNKPRGSDPTDIWECSAGPVQMDHPCFSGHVLLRRTQCFRHCCLPVITKILCRHQMLCLYPDETVGESTFLCSHLVPIMQVVFRRGQRGSPPWQSQSDPPGALHTNTCATVQREEHLLRSSIRGIPQMPQCAETHRYINECSVILISNCSSCGVVAGFNGLDLPVRGGRVPAHQLFQLQLLALCRSVGGRSHLPAHHSARQIQACEGAALFNLQILIQYIYMHILIFCRPHVC